MGYRQGGQESSPLYPKQECPHRNTLSHVFSVSLELAENKMVSGGLSVSIMNRDAIKPVFLVSDQV